MKRLAVILLAAAALGGCVTTRDGQTAPRPGPDMTPPPAPTLGMDWILNAEEDSAELVYGTPESDDLQLGFECRGGGDPILGLTRVAPEGSPSEIVLKAGDVTQRYAANAEPDQMSGGVILTTRLPRKTDPVIIAFRERGWLSVMHGGKAEHYIPQHNTTAVADFFNWCG